MQVTRSRPYNLELTAIIRAVQVIKDVVGRDWLQVQLDEAKSRPQPIDLSTYSYLYEPPVHPLVDWFLNFDRWREECIRTRMQALSGSVLRLTTLGLSLERARGQVNFSRLVSRLREQNQFDSAAFEAEVAATYLQMGCTVRFVEEGAEKTPDLRTAKDGIVVWVECKRRDLLTKLDRSTESIWREVESYLLRHLGPRKQNYLIVVRALRELQPADGDYLRRLIARAVACGGLGRVISVDGGTHAVMDPSHRFELLVRRLCDADQVLPATAMGFGLNHEADRAVLGGEVMVTNTGEAVCRNPLLIAFTSVVKPDRVAGVLDALKTARKQLPREGPGVVWIRIPDNAWADDLGAAFELAGDLLQSRLAGEHNRGVNAVFLHTQVTQQADIEGLQGLVYAPVWRRVDHRNPSSPVDLGAFHSMMGWSGDSRAAGTDIEFLEPREQLPRT